MRSKNYVVHLFPGNIKGHPEALTDMLNDIRFESGVKAVLAGDDTEATTTLARSWAEQRKTPIVRGQDPDLIMVAADLTGEGLPSVNGRITIIEDARGCGPRSSNPTAPDCSEASKTI